MKQFDYLYQFNSDGMKHFEQLFSGECSESDIGDPVSQHLACAVKGTTKWVIQEFSTAKEMASSVLGALGDLDISDAADRDGMWSWLVYSMRHQLFIRRSDGSWNVRARARWYPSRLDDWRKSQRHLVRSPVLLLSYFGEHANHLLCRSPRVMSEVREQLTSQQSMFSKVFQETACRLYFDPVKKNLKRGSSGKGGGSARRLAKVWSQFDVTWDLDELGCEGIMKMLPSEFDRFR